MSCLSSQGCGTCPLRISDLLQSAHAMCAVQASNSEGYDPLTQTPDGREKIMPLGYEKTELGPTTNFVGNHMTQGAIDLVKADLEEDSPVAAPMPRLAEFPAARPLGLSSGYSNELAPAAPTAQQIEHYGWEEVNVAIRLSISLALPPGSIATAHLQGAFQPGSFWLTVQHSASGVGPGAQHSLAITNLFGPINPQQSSMRISSGAPHTSETAHSSSSSSSSSRSSRDIVKRQQHTGYHKDSDSDVLILVLLVKQDPQQHWPCLTQQKDCARVPRWVKPSYDTCLA